MALTLNKFNGFVADVMNKSHNFASDTFKLFLTNGAPVATNATTADLTEISAGNGYVAGGPSITITSSLQSSGTWKWIIADLTLTASGGSIGPFRYIVVNNSTANKMVGWYDRGSSLTLLDTDSWTFDNDQVAGLIQLA